MLRIVEFGSGLCVYVCESPIPKDCPRADAINLPLSLPPPQQSNCFSADFQAFSIWGEGVSNKPIIYPEKFASLRLTIF